MRNGIASYKLVQYSLYANGGKRGLQSVGILTLTILILPVPSNWALNKSGTLEAKLVCDDWGVTYPGSGSCKKNDILSQFYIL